MQRDTIFDYCPALQNFRNQLTLNDEVFVSTQHNKTRGFWRDIESTKREYDDINERIKQHLQRVSNAQRVLPLQRGD